MSDVRENLDWLEHQLNRIALKQEESERVAKEHRLADAAEKEKLQEWKWQQEWNDQDQQAEVARVMKMVQNQQEEINAANARQNDFMNCVFTEWKRDREEDQNFKHEVLVELKNLRDDVIEWKRRLYNKTVRFDEHPKVFIFGDDTDPNGSINNTNQVKKKEPVLEATEVSTGCDECSGMIVLEKLQNSMNRLEEGVPAFHDELEKIQQKVEELKWKVQSIDEFQKNSINDTKTQVNQIRVEQKESFEEIQKAHREELEALRNVILEQVNKENVEMHSTAPTPDLITPSVTPLPSRESSYNNNNPLPKDRHHLCTNNNTTTRRIEPTRPPNYLTHFPTLVYRLFPEYCGDATRREALLGWINSSASQEEIHEKIAKIYRSAVYNTELVADE